MYFPLSHSISLKLNVKLVICGGGEMKDKIILLKSYFFILPHSFESHSNWTATKRILIYSIYRLVQVTDFLKLSTLLFIYVLLLDSSDLQRDSIGFQLKLIINSSNTYLLSTYCVQGTWLYAFMPNFIQSSQLLSEVKHYNYLHLINLKSNTGKLLNYLFKTT